MTTLRIVLTAGEMAFQVDEQRSSVPIGPASLAAGLRHDPPQAEELSNAVGLVLDHMEDVERELPEAVAAERIEVCGDAVSVLADVEFGGDATLPYELHRDAAEDVFRTLVTESAADRARNPGLPPAEVHHVLGVVSTVVAVMRFLGAERVWVVAP